MKQNAAIIVAAGNGTRIGGDIPKQYLPLRGKAMLAHSYQAFLDHPDIHQIIVVIGEGQEEPARQSLTGMEMPRFVIGGDTRQESVAAGLAALNSGADVGNVLIHDAARPGLNAEVIDRLLAALESHGGAVPALPVVDSLARGSATMAETVERQDLWRIQTPQAFNFGMIAKAHAEWDSAQEATDDARMVTALGVQVALVQGDEALAKYTFAEDFEGDEAAIGRTMRVGSGYDVHRLAEGEELWLCGVKIDHSHGLAGHSDADVAIHALVDAILGAAALGDIGDHFPPSDPQWRGASSDRFLAHAAALVSEIGFAISNVDVTIICEAPKIGPHKLVMRERLAEILKISLDRVSVKATTTEKLGFTGRGEGIAAQAVATLIKEG
jgi:2-C-methyl-D-erythritol 4-phosphate cytidylyltransferase/2-C-methyl-D-erythritol 2,4-cyclodiphosphate synthase